MIISLGDFMAIDVHACVGGTAVRDDINKLRNGVHVVVGTPGRVYDMINRRALRLQNVKLFVLDEVSSSGVGHTSKQAPKTAFVLGLWSAEMAYMLTGGVYNMFVCVVLLVQADEMLSRGFKEQIYDVFRFLPEKVQCALFSATMPLDVSTNKMTPTTLQQFECVCMVSDDRVQSFCVNAAERRIPLL